jgi:segregation and condensation protein B
MSDWKKIEALLFASGKYLTEEQLVVLAKIPKNKIKKTLSDLQKHYEKTDTSLKIYNEADAWKLNVKEEYTDVIREVVSDAEMPRAVMETLAIIAYKSPVLQSEIKDIRGASVYDHIPLLEAKGFITRDKYGRSYKIKLTNKFHEYFDIEGDSKLAELFKDVKKPEKPEKLGELDVYEAKEDDKFNQQILDRMKKLEKTKKDDEEENNFLNEFDEKYEKTKKNIDESEQDIESFRKKTDEDTKEIFQDKKIEEQENNEQETEEIEQNEKEIEEDTQNDEDTEIDRENLIDDEEIKDVPKFLNKINKQIDELTANREDLKEIEKDIEQNKEEKETNNEKDEIQDDDKK